MQICNRRNEKSKRNVVDKRRREEEQEYHHKRRDAHKIITNKKNTYMKNVIESIDKKLKK